MTRHTWVCRQVYKSDPNWREFRCRRCLTANNPSSHERMNHEWGHAGRADWVEQNNLDPRQFPFWKYRCRRCGTYLTKRTAVLGIEPTKQDLDEYNVNPDCDVQLVRQVMEM